MGIHRHTGLISALALSILIMSYNIARAADVTHILKSLEKNLSAIESIDADFTQEKTLTIFKSKLKMTGRIYMQKPSKFAWHLETPIKSRMIISGEKLKQWDAESGKVEKVDLGKNPMFLNATKQMQLWFSGNYSSLTSEYVISVVSVKPVVLKLVPMANNMAKSFMKEITVSFREDEKYVQSILITEASGDTTHFRFMETKLNCPIPEKAWRVKP